MSFARTAAQNAHFVAWTIALLSVVISLFLSNILGFLPCNLCWYARILMYPLVVIIGMGILRHETHWVLYAAPLVAAGWLLELYHSLLQWGIIPEEIASCIATTPCTTKYINYLGFITIPFLGLLAFTGLGVCLYVFVRANRSLPTGK